jgi:multicomponent Na+:H+ antiporter subunit C
MNIFLFALVVGVIIACGTYLVLRRSPIRLVLGLVLLSHAVNLLIFSTSSPLGGYPPIISDKAAFDGDVSGMADPLPQALILTAIVISFGVTAFMVVLINRRNTLSQPAAETSDVVPSRQMADPFAPMEHYTSGLDQDPDDYQWLEYSIASEYRSHAEHQHDERDAARPDGAEHAHASDATGEAASDHATGEKASEESTYVQDEGKVRE